MIKNQNIKKIIAPFFIVAAMVAFIALSSSCREELSFGDLVVCREVDEVTFAPVEAKDSFEINEDGIFAVIEVKGARASDEWGFVWINEDTGRIVAKSYKKYSDNNDKSIEGYLSNCLTPSEEAGIIGEPGSYSVNFYHNGDLISSECFNIEKPVPEVTKVVLSGEIDDEGQPIGDMELFYPDDAIYALVEMDYQIAGETLNVKWYKGEDELLGEKEIEIENNYFMPGFVVFEMVNDAPWPVGDYRVDIYHNGVLNGGYAFEVVREKFPDATFDENNIYEKEDYKISVLYPDGWVYEEGESDRGLEVDIIPQLEDIGKSVEIKIMVLKENYYPLEEDYSDFSKDLLEEVFNYDDGTEIKNLESEKDVSGITGKYINYYYTKENNEGWIVDFIFIEKNNMLYLIVKISDVYYMDFADSLFETMVGSISFD